MDNVYKTLIAPYSKVRARNPLPPARIQVNRWLPILFAMLFLHGCSDDSEAPKADEAGGVATRDITAFINAARFLPNNPEKMTAEDKAWFSANVWKLNWGFTLDGTELTADQRTVAEIEMAATLKTLNYVVYTKPFAVYLQKLFEQNQLVSVSQNKDDSPDPLAILLAYRGLTSEHFEGKRLDFRLIKTGAWTGVIDGKSTMKASTDEFALDDARKGKWDFHATLPGSFKRVNIPFGTYSEPDYFVSDFTRCGSRNGSPGNMFSINLTVHEMAHTLFGWGHPGGQGKDLVYAVHGLVGNLTWGWGDNGDNVEGIGGPVDEKVVGLENAVGGHLPMAMRCWQWPFWGNYTINIQYILHHRGIQIIPIAHADTGLGSQLKENPAVPKDPFEGVNWANLVFDGFKPL